MKINHAYCPICGTRSLEVLKRLPNNFGVLWCTACRVDMVIILEPQVDEEQVAREQVH